MAGYDAALVVDPIDAVETKDFFRFLRAIGRKYPVRFSYRTIGSGHFYLTIDGNSGSLDAWIQELLLNRGAYYYAASRRNRRRVISSVVIPTLRALIEPRFPNDYSHFLNHHITGRGLPQRYQPGEFFHSGAHDFEVLFRRWDIGSISDSEFVNLLDELLTNFMLTKLRVPKGSRSPRFDQLLYECSRKGWLDKQSKKAFASVHRARTAGLHRRTRLLSKHELVRVVLDLYQYFDYVDDRFVKGERLFVPLEFR